MHNRFLVSLSLLRFTIACTLFILWSGSTYHTFYKIRCLSVELGICKSFTIILSHLSLLCLFGDCGKPELADNMLPVSNLPQNIGAKIRIQCAEGYVRKAGTSNQIRCTQQQNGNASWHSDLPLKCIPDPKKPHVATTETQRPPQQFTSSSTERTARKHPILHGTSSPTTGHIALKTTNEVVTTKSRRTTSQPTLMSTTKETESITTTNETTTSYTSKEYMTTTSSHTLSGSFTTITGINASVRTSTISEGGNKVAVFSDGYTSTIGGVTGIILLCLVAVFIFLWLRHKNHRNQIVYHSNPDSCTYIPVCESEHSSAQSNKAAESSTEEFVIYKNPGIPHGPDTCDKLLPQTDS